MRLRPVIGNKRSFWCIQRWERRPIVLIPYVSGGIQVRYRKGPGWTGLDTNNLFLLNCRRERQTNPNPNPGLLR